MLDAITDFWKPSRKQGEDAAIDLAKLQVGATVGFGFIPQTRLNGKRVKIHAINTYEFGDERLTSFVLNIDGDTSVSMVIADSDTEKYVVLSRRIPFAERMRIFDNAELLALIENADQKRLQARELDGEWKEWMVSQYKKAIHGLSGRLIVGDFRHINTLPDDTNIKPFTYTLLGSSNSEYAVEVEQYGDNRIELYATVYRRLSDIGEIQSPVGAAELAHATASPVIAKAEPAAANDREPIAPQPEMPAPASPVNAPMLEKPEDTLQASAPEFIAKPEAKDDIKQAAAALVEESKTVTGMSKELPKAEEKKEEPIGVKAEINAEIASEPIKSAEPVTLSVAEEKKAEEKPQEIKSEIKSEIQSEIKPEIKAEIKPEAPVRQPDVVADKVADKPAVYQPELPSQSETISHQPKEPTIMPPYNPSVATSTNHNGSAAQSEQAAAAAQPQVRAVSRPPLVTDNDAIECELKAANKIIEEAIRNEIRLSDVVRRIVALPLANPESVQIPVTLAEADYQLLAIRYGMSANDKTAIKARVIEEVNDFAGNNK